MEIRLENVSKSYDRPVLKALNYCFEGGKLYVIKGVSGCGKSTLLNILGGVEKEYEGSIIYEPQKLRSAYIFQRSLLLSTLHLHLRRGADTVLILCDHGKAGLRLGHIVIAAY